VSAESGGETVAGRVEWFRGADYENIRRLQHRYVEEVARGERPPTLLIGWHDHVITVGRSGKEKNLLLGRDGWTPPAGLERPRVIEVERGGDVTYHGPGQLVGYPIVSLNERRDLHRYLRALEEVLIRTLASIGLEGFRREGLTGVWVGEEKSPRKIASIGVAVRRWVAYHGFALNVSTDLRYFSLLNPCGLDAAVMTSVENETGRKMAIEIFGAAIVLLLEKLLSVRFR
jgi:lipoate-protein ligase B